MSGLLIAAIAFGMVTVVELPDNSGLASLVLGTRYRPAGVCAGTAAAFAMHAVLAVGGGSETCRVPRWRTLPLGTTTQSRWISRVAALVMVVMAAVTLARQSADARPGLAGARKA